MENVLCLLQLDFSVEYGVVSGQRHELLRMATQWSGNPFVEPIIRKSDVRRKGIRVLRRHICT